MKKILKSCKSRIFKNYSTDIALRCLPVIDIIKEEGFWDLKILEVGSGDLGITPYFKKNIIGLDIEFSNQGNEFLKKVKYDGKKFPFRDNEFDLVISIDNLEHIAREKRQEFINEIMRTAEKEIIIVAPCGQSAYKHDQELSGYFYKIHGYTDKFFAEHLENRLPEVEELRRMLENAANTAGKKIGIKKEKKLLNIKIRSMIMRCKISQNIVLSILYYLFLLLLLIRNFLNFGKCYRRLLYVKIS